MINCGDLVSRVLSRVPNNMPVLIEYNGHNFLTLQLNIETLNNLPGQGYYVICIRTKKTMYKEFLLESSDEELFPDDLWTDNYAFKSDYIRDWLIGQFNLQNPDVLSSWQEKTIVSKVAIIGYSGGKLNTVEELLSKLKSDASIFPAPVYFPYEDYGIKYSTTILNGIGLNKKEIVFEQTKIEPGKALIINLNQKMNNWENEICDFSLFRKFPGKRWPKKYSPNLYQCLICERRN